MVKEEHTPVDWGVILGLIAYPVAFLSWWLEDWLVGSKFIIFILLPTLPWALCILLLTVVRCRPLKFYWWVLPTAVPALHSLWLGCLMLLAWSFGGFV